MQAESKQDEEERRNRSESLRKERAAVSTKLKQYHELVIYLLT